jgi:hypothetical protein
MKKNFKAHIAPLFGIAVLVAAIGFSIAGCKTEDTEDNDYEMLNGVWDREDIVVTFNNSDGVFTQIEPDSGWQKVLDRGHINIGEKKFRNITGGNLKWTAQQLTYNTATFTVKDWSDCTITMAPDGKTLREYDADTVTTNRVYTKKQ